MCGEDVHTQTAARDFDVPISEVTDAQRLSSKRASLLFRYAGSRVVPGAVTGRFRVSTVPALRRRPGRTGS